MAHSEDKLVNQQSSILMEGYYQEDHPLHEIAMDGVSCTLCHQIENINLNNEASFSGQYSINNNLPEGARLAYGPFQPPMGLANRMQAESGFLPTHRKKNCQD